MTFDSNAHHGWGLPNEPQRRFPRDDPDPKAHGPVRAARATQATRVDLDDRTPIATRIEPELRAIVDQAMERVAVLEVESKRREQEAFDGVLERLSGLLDGLDQLAGSVGGVARSMRQELEGLNGVVTELTSASTSLEEELSELPPEPKLEPASADVVSAGEPPAEITRMFRRQMENMWRAGTSRAETERWLMRFELGEHHRYLLDEIYSIARIQPRKRRKGLIGRLRAR